MSLASDIFNKNVLTSAGKSILDIGCGAGRFCEWARFHKFDYYGVDIDEECIRHAKINNPQYADSFAVWDASHGLSMFQDKSYDTIIMIEVIEHITKQFLLEALIKDCMRVASKNIMFTTPNCSDEEFLRKNKIIYDHYIMRRPPSPYHATSHLHHQKFTKATLTNLLSPICSNFEIVERVPMEIITTKVCYYKLWAEIKVS